MKRKNTDIYANINEDSVQQSEEQNQNSQQIMIQQQNQKNQSDTKQNKIDTKINNAQKKDSKLKTNEFQINHNQVKDKFQNILNSQKLVDDDVSTPRDKFMMKSNNQSGFETQRQSMIKKQIDQVFATKSTGKSSFLQQFDDHQESKKKISGSNSLFGMLNSASKEQTEQKPKIHDQYNRLTQYQNTTQSSQKVNSETDVMKNKKSDSQFINELKSNDLQMNNPSSLPGIFIQPKYTTQKQSQNSSTQNKSLSLSYSKSQFDIGKVASQNETKPLNKAALILNFNPFSQSISNDQKRLKTLEDSGYKSESGKLNISQNNSIRQNNVKFKRLQNTDRSQKESTILKSSTFNDFRNVSYLHQKQDSVNPILMETPLISQFDQETNLKLKTTQALNNVYLKMLDEFQIPYEQDLEKIRSKISELKLQSTEGADNVDKSFIIKILQNQLDSQKVENLKNKQLRVPSNRYDVEVLKQWLDFMIFKIYQDGCNSGQEILEKVQTVFESCFQEVLKQVTVECSERGNLLKKVWDNQNELFTKLVEEQQHKRLQQEQESLDEITRVHKMYTKEIERLRQNLQTVNDEKNKLSERFDLIKTNVKYLKKNNKYVNKMLKTLKEDLHFYQKKNEELEYAANKLKRDYLNLSNTQQLMPITKTKIKSKNKLSTTSKTKQSEQSISELKQLGLDNKEGHQQKKQDLTSNQTLANIKQRQNEESDGQDNESEQSDQSSERENENKKSKTDKINRESLEGHEVKQISSEENMKTINAILEQQQQLSVLQAKYTQNQYNITPLSDDDEDIEFEQSIVLSDKSIDAQDWHNDFCLDLEIQTDARMGDMIFKNDIVYEDVCTQIDHNALRELGGNNQDKEVQTTDLDPEYEERMKGQDVQGLEKFLDNIQKAEDSYERAVDSVNIPFEVKKAMHNYLKHLHKNKEQMHFLLKTEIGIKEKYHKENITLKLSKKEKQILIVELQNKIEQLIEANKTITEENQQLDRNVVNLVRRTKKLTTNMEKFQQLSTQIYTESNKLAGNIKKSNVFDQFISQVAAGGEVSQGDIEQLRNKFQTSKASDNNLGLKFTKSSLFNISQQDLDEGERQANNQQHTRDAPHSNAIQKIRRAVQQLVDINIHSFIDDELHSSSSDDSGDDLENPNKIKKKAKKSNQDNQMTISINTDSQVLNSSQKSGIFDRMTKSTQQYKFNNPKFERRRVVKINSINISASTFLFNRIKRKMQKGQPKMTMSKKNLCKFIGQIYFERSKNDQNRSETFHVMVYDYFLSNFGLKKVAETKIMQLYEAIFFFRHKSVRIKLFGQFLGIFEGSQSDELDFYIQQVSKLDEESPSFVQVLNQVSEVVYCSFEKIFNLLKKQEEGTSKLFIDKQIAYIQQNRIISKQNNNYPIIDVDVAMEKIIEGYKKIKQNNKELDMLFNAADLDSDGVVGFYEFMCLYKYIEDKEEDKESMRFAEKIYFTKCDALNDDTGEKSLSIDAFISMCTLNGFFKQDKVQKFMSSNLSPQECQNYEQLCKGYNDLFQQIKMRLYKAGAFTSFFSKGISNLIKIIKSQPQEGEQKQSVWISYRILEYESKKAILLFELQECLPSQFIDLMIKYKESGPDAEDDYWPIEYSNIADNMY